MKTKVPTDKQMKTIQEEIRKDKVASRARGRRSAGGGMVENER